MQTLTKLAVFAVLTLMLCAAPLYAGMEPFYKGEWGMSPTEVQAFYPDMGKNTTNANATQQLEISTTIAGYPAKVVYYFDGLNKLYQVKAEFKPALTSVSEAKSFLAELTYPLAPQIEKEPFTHETDEFNFPAEGVWNGFHTWQSTEDYVGLMATITYAETDRAETIITLDACDARNPINGVYSQADLDSM